MKISVKYSFFYNVLCKTVGFMLYNTYVEFQIMQSAFNVALFIWSLQDLDLQFSFRYYQ